METRHVIYFIIFWVVLISIAILVYFLVHHSKTKKCSKTCSDNSDCPDDCPVCYQGKCCNPDCVNKSCDQEDGCGKKCGCANANQVCDQGVCCIPQCDGIVCGPGVQQCGGKECKCGPDQVCYQGECCTPKVCDGTYCGPRGCGLGNCECNTRSNLGSCIRSKCVYDNICNIPNKTDQYLFQEWAKFCGNCENCQLISPTFQGDSIVPLSGQIQCEKCKSSSGWNSSINPVSINKDVRYYQTDSNGNIIPGPNQPNYCSDNKCKCDCVINDDCKRWGCTTCIGQTCK